MKTRTLAAAAIFLALAALPAASAHQTWYDNGKTLTPASKVKFVYGNLYEPVSTFQKTGLDLGISDAKGNPITGLDAVDHDGTPIPGAPVHAELVYSGQKLDLTSEFKAEFGKPGWYTRPYIYTKAGAYQLHVWGTINGTAVDVTIEPAHEVEDSSDLMWPDHVSSPGDQADEIAQLKSDVAALKDSKKAPGLETPVMVLGIIALAALATAFRRTR